MYSALRPHVEKKIQIHIIPHVQYSLSMVPTAIVNGRRHALDLYDSILCSEISFASNTSVNDDDCTDVDACTMMGQPVFLVGFS